MEELTTHRYENHNLIVCDAESGWVVHADQEPDVVPLDDGLNIISNQNVNDPNDDRVSLANRLLTLQLLDSPVKFLAVNLKVFARGPSPAGRATMVMRGKDYGTVSGAGIDCAQPQAAMPFSNLPMARQTKPSTRTTRRCRDILSRGLAEPANQSQGYLIE